MLLQRNRIASAAAFTLALGATLGSHAWASPPALANAEAGLAGKSQVTLAVQPSPTEGMGGQPATSTKRDGAPPTPHSLGLPGGTLNPRALN
jgi:hypothetical protein